tara:strand:+ start:496 stop:1548 length:1053 start_codon:yes stop_codon:yes gene_type:complete
MAYQNVGTPRFYVDSGLYQSTIGAWIPEHESGSTMNKADQLSLAQLNPTNVIAISPPEERYKVPRISPIRYMAVLGHNGGTGGYIYPVWGYEVGDVNDNEGCDNLVQVVNGQPWAQQTVVEHSGFSIWTFADDETQSQLELGIGNADWELGAVSMGNYYDMQAPDLNLKLSYEYDGVKNIQTKGGATLSNASYTKPPDWGNGMGAWQLGEPANPSFGSGRNYRSGRRTWDLSFSYLSSEDIMYPTMTDNLRIFDDSQYTLTDNFFYSENASGNVWNQDHRVNTHNDFFSQVWNKTMGGHLPFIFNPNGGGDSPNNNPDQFAICRFDQSSLQYNQIAPNTYNVKLKIRESW